MGGPPNKKLDPRLIANSIGGIMTGSVIDQQGFGRHSERFEVFRGLRFSERFHKVVRKI